MNLVYQSAFLKALGLSLLDSLWQMGILWLVYVILTGNSKRFNSKQRHTIALLSLSGGSIWFLITLVINFYGTVNAPASVVMFTSENISKNPGIFSFVSLFEPALPFLSIVYLAFLFCLLIRFYQQYRHTQRLFSSSIIKADPELRVFMNKMAAMLTIKKNIRIWVSEFVDTPLTIGFWKPIILLPVAAVNHLSIQQAEAIILHELYHIKRNDYLVNLLIAFLDILLFFNPFSRMLTDIIKKERENSCDDLVIQFRYDAKQYVHALLMLEKNRVNKHLFTVAATGKNKSFLLNRVKRILYNEKVPASQITQRLAGSLFTAFIIGFIGLYNPGDVILKKMEERARYTASQKREISEFPASIVFDVKSAEKSPSKKKVVKSNRLTHENDKLLPQQGVSFYQLNGEDEEVMENVTENLINFVQTQPEVLEFSIVETEPVIAPPVYSSQYPFIPKSSFSYHYTEDTTLPKKKITTISEKKAEEALEQALKAMEEINWAKLEKELGKKVDAKKLQEEMKKALTELNWKKINEEIQSSLKESMDSNEEILLQLEKLQEHRAIKQEKLQKIKEKVVEDIFHSSEQKKSDNCEKVKVKKIVVI